MACSFNTYDNYDNYIADMEPTATQHRATLDSSLPFRTLKPSSSQFNITQFPNYKKEDGTGRYTDLPELPYSPISERSGSSFSQASADSWERSTEPSSPQSTKLEHDFDDIPRLGPIPPRGEVLKRKFASSDESSKKTRFPPVHLPGVSCLLSPSDGRNPHPIRQPSVKGHLHTPNASPEHRNEQIILNKSGDPITDWLNSWRRESGDTRIPLSEPQGLGAASLDIKLDFHETTPPVFYREKQQYTPQPRGCNNNRLYQRQLPKRLSPPLDTRGKGKVGRAKSKKPHNNIKYLTEEADYIRFNKYELKQSWDENLANFVMKFPMADPINNRGRQGIQGVHYRDNQHVPHLADRGRRLVFMNEGHVKANISKVRDQGENKPYFSLTYLYPERTMLYDWVPDKFKHMAAELVKERIPQKEAARRDAIKRGTWKERLDTDECACCTKPDRERDNHKRCAPDPSQADSPFVPPRKREFNPKL